MQFPAIYKLHAPFIIKWIHTTLNNHSTDKIPVSKLDHSRAYEIRVSR